jgi:hypothetical protein
MLFNPLFIEKSSGSTNGSVIAKNSKIAGASYLFNDIINVLSNNISLKDPKALTSSGKQFADNDAIELNLLQTAEIDTKNYKPGDVKKFIAGLLSILGNNESNADIKIADYKVPKENLEKMLKNIISQIKFSEDETSPNDTTHISKEKIFDLLDDNKGVVIAVNQLKSVSSFQIVKESGESYNPILKKDDNTEYLVIYKTKELDNNEQNEQIGLTFAYTGIINPQVPNIDNNSGLLTNNSSEEKQQVAFYSYEKKNDENINLVNPNYQPNSKLVNNNQQTNIGQQETSIISQDNKTSFGSDSVGNINVNKELVDKKVGSEINYNVAGNKKNSGIDFTDSTKSVTTNIDKSQNLSTANNVTNKITEVLKTENPELVQEIHKDLNNGQIFVQESKATLKVSSETILTNQSKEKIQNNNKSDKDSTNFINVSTKTEDKDISVSEKTELVKKPNTKNNGELLTNNKAVENLNTIGKNSNELLEEKPQAETVLTNQPVDKKVNKEEVTIKPYETVTVKQEVTNSAESNGNVTAKVTDEPKVEVDKKVNTVNPETATNKLIEEKVNKEQVTLKPNETVTVKQEVTNTAESNGNVTAKVTDEPNFEVDKKASTVKPETVINKPIEEKVNKEEVTVKPNETVTVKQEVTNSPESKGNVTAKVTDEPKVEIDKKVNIINPEIATNKPAEEKVNKEQVTVKPNETVTVKQEVTNSPESKGNVTAKVTDEPKVEIDKKVNIINPEIATNKPAEEKVNKEEVTVKPNETVTVKQEVTNAAESKGNVTAKVTDEPKVEVEKKVNTVNPEIVNNKPLEEKVNKEQVTIKPNETVTVKQEVTNTAESKGNVTAKVTDEPKVEVDKKVNTENPEIVNNKPIIEKVNKEQVTIKPNETGTVKQEVPKIEKTIEDLSNKKPAVENINYTKDGVKQADKEIKTTINVMENAGKNDGVVKDNIYNVEVNKNNIVVKENNKSNKNVTSFSLHPNRKEKTEINYELNGKDKSAINDEANINQVVEKQPKKDEVNKIIEPVYTKANNNETENKITLYKTDNQKPIEKLNTPVNNSESGNPKENLNRNAAINNDIRFEEESKKVISVKVKKAVKDVTEQKQENIKNEIAVEVKDKKSVTTENTKDEINIDRGKNVTESGKQSHTGNGFDFKENKETVANLNVKIGETENIKNGKVFDETFVKAGNERNVKLTEVIKEVSRYLEKQDKSSLTLNIEPENMGKVKISVEVTDKIVKANITVETEVVKNMLESKLGDLQSNLNKNTNQQGMINISLQQNEQKNNERQAGKKKISGENKQVDKIETETEETKKSLGYNTVEYIA